MNTSRSVALSVDAGAYATTCIYVHSFVRELSQVCELTLSPSLSEKNELLRLGSDATTRDYGKVKEWPSRSPTTLLRT